MVTIGYDCGTQSTKAVLLRDGQILCKASELTAFDAGKAVKELKEKLLKDSGLTESEIDGIAVTGVGRTQTPGEWSQINEVSAAAKGAFFLFPEVDCVIDLGANNSKAIKLGDDGSVITYEVNDKCASGTGTFIEAMARLLNVPIDEFGRLSLGHTKDITISAQCAVFVESEVISLVHQRETAEDIAHGVLAGIASRTSAMVKRLGTIRNIAVIGGPALNVGLISCLEKELKTSVMVPENAQYVQAVGAALYAAGK